VIISVDDERLNTRATSVDVTDDTLSVELEDGRTISVPLAWYPRLAHGSADERRKYTIGHWGIHWEDLDEDISIKGLLLGQKSGESQASLARWLRYYRAGKRPPVKTLPLPEWAKSPAVKPKRQTRRRK
jgi:hypothetical protein